MKKVVVVGGGAGGLELVTRLTKKLQRKGLAEVILVDKSRTHIWKPLLHEVAAGVIDKASDGVDYRVHATRVGYDFQLGNMSGIERERKVIHIDPLLDDNGDELLPAREIAYDYLVLAVGSVSNDFGTAGVAEHCYFLDSIPQAERFHKALLNQLIRVNQSADENAVLKVAIVGAGATGTELAAQLHHVSNLARAYGMPDMSPKKLKVSIIEAGPRILPALPERISNSARKALNELGIEVLENTMVKSAQKGGFIDGNGNTIDADLMLWAAGVKAPNYIADMNLFEVNRANQILVKPTLESTVDEDIFVIGDCCGFQQEDGSWVPPRAQSAHQMAATAATNLVNRFHNRESMPYVYKDYGSLVHLSKYSTVGSLMGALVNSSMFIEGRLAKLVYISLYNMHQFAVHGWFKASLILLSRKVSKLVGPKLKLH